MKKIGILLFIIIMAVVMTAQAKVRTEYRAGGLFPLIIDDSIKDCLNCPSPTEQPTIPVKKASDSKKHKASAVVKDNQENVSVGLNVEFDTAKALIKEKYHNDIKKVAQTPSKMAIFQMYIICVHGFWKYTSHDQNTS